MTALNFNCNKTGITVFFFKVTDETAPSFNKVGIFEHVS